MDPYTETLSFVQTLCLVMSTVHRDTQKHLPLFNFMYCKEYCSHSSTYNTKPLSFVHTLSIVMSTVQNSGTYIEILTSVQTLCIVMSTIHKGNTQNTHLCTDSVYCGEYCSQQIYLTCCEQFA